MGAEFKKRKDEESKVKGKAYRSGCISLLNSDVTLLEPLDSNNLVKEQESGFLYSNNLPKAQRKKEEKKAGESEYQRIKYKGKVNEGRKSKKETSDIG